MWYRNYPLSYAVRVPPVSSPPPLKPSPPRTRSHLRFPSCPVVPLQEEREDEEIVSCWLWSPAVDAEAGVSNQTR